MRFKRNCIFFLFLLSLASCRKGDAGRGGFGAFKSGEVSGRSDRPLIGLSIDTLVIERWQRDLDIFMAKAKELGADVIVQNAGNSVEEQNRQLLYLLDRKVDVVVLLPKESRAHKDVIAKIRSKNVHVISYDRLAVDSDISMYITIDSRKVGRLMGTRMAGISKNRDWFYMMGPEGDYNMSMILSGIHEAVNADLSGSRIFYTDGWNYDLARQRALDMVLSGNIPDAIICGNDALCDSVISVFKLYYPKHHVNICGQDADIAACKNVLDGSQDFTVYKPILKLAETAAECAVKISRGESPENLCSRRTDNGFSKIPSIMLDPVLVDKSNLHEVIVGSGFHTETEIYN